MNESQLQEWIQERSFLLLRLKNEAQQRHILSEFDEWIRKNISEIPEISYEKLPLEIPWRSHELLTWMIREKEFADWDREYSSR